MQFIKEKEGIRNINRSNRILGTLSRKIDNFDLKALLVFVSFPKEREVISLVIKRSFIFM